MKTLLKTCFLILISFNSFCQTTTTKEITDNFFKIYPEDIIKAFDYGFSTNKYFDLADKSVIDLKNKLTGIVSQCGKYYGAEQIAEKTSGSCLKIVNYFVKYERQPIRFTFIFYKPDDKWQVQNLAFEIDFDEELKDAVKLNTIPEKK